MVNNLDSVARRRASLDLRDGDKWLVSQPDISILVAIGEECLRRYKREQIKIRTENADLLEQDQRQAFIDRAFTEAAKLTEADLPSKRISIRGKSIVEGDARTRQVTVDYATWWSSQTTDGMLFALWLCIKREPGQEDVTYARVKQEYSQPDGQVDLEHLNEAANTLGQLSETRLADQDSGHDRDEHDDGAGDDRTEPGAKKKQPVIASTSPA